MKIDFINHPYAYTNSGRRLHVSEISGGVRVGVSIEEKDGRYAVTGNNADPDCVGGVCPIK